MRLSNYLKIYPCPDSPGHLLLYSTRRCSVVRVPERTLYRIEDGTLPEDDRKTLSRLGILVPDPAAERAEMLGRFAEANRLSKKFHAIVVLNLDCNLACPYCFEEGVRVGSYMSPETADALVAMIEREQLARGRQVSLDFYGGEPLLSRDLIRSIAGRLKNAAEEQGLPFSFSLVTNGTLLTSSLTKELKAFGLHGAKITLDGPRETHDRSRPFASGKGSSFDVIVRNLRAVWDVVDLQIGGNFTRENYPEFPRLLDHLIAVGLTPEKLRSVSFNPVMKTIGGAALPDFRAGCDCANEPWLIDAALFLREETLKRGFTVPKPGPAGCMVEFANELVVNMDGALYKCPAFVGRQGFAVGDLRSGVTDDGAVYGPAIWKKPECRECAYLPQCFGGCRFLKFVRDGNISDVDCWKPFLDATLEACIRQDQLYRAGKR
ncbi:MAG TPA: geopeptide radical SAM maturase [Geobacteraceae bacterium]|nr:geopeptide radical SAM maturase [Geobacteraceae bacterium]